MFESSDTAASTKQRTAAALNITAAHALLTPGTRDGMIWCTSSLNVVVQLLLCPVLTLACAYEVCCAGADTILVNVATVSSDHQLRFLAS